MQTAEKKQKKARITELDFLKGVFITLMVTFHLALIENDYPVIYKAVYTFHMPAFLIISGYLANINKNLYSFCKGMLRIIVPFIIFESIYVAMLYFVGRAVGANNSVSEFSLMSMLTYIADTPKGPYWYLHTLIICSVTYYISYTLLRLKLLSGLILTALLLYGISLICGMSWINAWYFLIGIFIARCSGGVFTDIIKRSWIAVLPLLLLFANEDNMNRGTLAGITITLLVISLMLQVYEYTPSKIRKFVIFLGKNSLAIVVFSPIFTAGMKKLAPLFYFDSTDICFAICATSLTIGLSILSASVIDRIKISRFLFFKDKIYEKL